MNITTKTTLEDTHYRLTSLAFILSGGTRSDFLTKNKAYEEMVKCKQNRETHHRLFHERELYILPFTRLDAKKNEVHHWDNQDYE